MRNPNNYTILYGLLKHDPIIHPNTDGSKRVQITLLVNDNGNTIEIPCQGFLPKTYKGTGPYGYLKQGEPVEVECCLRASKQWGINLQIDQISFGKNMQQKRAQMFSEETTSAQAIQPDTETSNTDIQTVTYNDDIPDFGEELEFS